jgi:NitT/TauT family transport system substrate-binding protein
MRTRRVRGIALLVTAVTLMLAAGCSSGGSTATDTSGEQATLTVGVVPALDSAGFFIAYYDGLFKAQGLTINPKFVTSSETAIALQVKGEYQITGGNYVSYIQAQQAGRANLDIFAEGSVMEPGAQDLYTMPASSIRSLGDLKGRSIAINAPDNILYLLAASVLTEHGISPKEVHFVTNYAFPQMPAQLNAGTINAAVLPEPFASIAEESYGAVPLADLNQGATTSFPVEGYVVTKQWAKQNPQALAAFYRALEEGQQIADTNRAAVEQAMEKLPAPLGLSKQTAALMSVDEYPVTPGPVGNVDKDQLQRVVDVMQQYLGFDQNFNINSMLMNGG